MRKKRTIGIIMFVVGVVLKELSYLVDIWIIHFVISVIASVIGLSGATMSIKAMIYLNNEKKNQESEKKNS